MGVWHEPPMHSSEPLQHSPPQSGALPGQRQEPPLQLAPRPQGLLQPPQWLSSLLVLTQLLLQRV